MHCCHSRYKAFNCPIKMNNCSYYLAKNGKKKGNALIRNLDDLWSLYLAMASNILPNAIHGYYDDTLALERDLPIYYSLPKHRFGEELKKYAFVFCVPTIKPSKFSRS